MHRDVCSGSCQECRDYVGKFSEKFNKDPETGHYHYVDSSGKEHDDINYGATFQEFGECPEEHQGKNREIDKILSMVQEGCSDSVSGFNDIGVLDLIDLTLAQPILKVVPDTSLIQSTYSVNTRAASITGDYGVIGDNNTVTNIGSQSIVNETDNSVYNPVTEDTTTYDSWTYDYSTRTYTFTVSNDDNSVTTSIVEYGDKNITIIEGDTTYNIYYLISDESGSDSDSGTGSSGDVGSGTATDSSDDTGSSIISKITKRSASSAPAVYVRVLLLECVEKRYCMAELIAEFFTVIGVDQTAPTTLGELIPYLLTVFVGVFLVAVTFRVIGKLSELFTNYKSGSM